MKPFSTENHADMFPPTVDHNEVVKQVREHLSRDHYPQFIGMGEVGLGHVSHLRCLTDDDIAIRVPSGWKSTGSGADAADPGGGSGVIGTALAFASVWLSALRTPAKTLLVLQH